MPTRLRGPLGQTVDVEDSDVGYYQQQGYTPLSSEQEYREDVATAAKPDDRGIIGSVGAAATGFLSGVTLGASDVALSSLATKNEREQIYEDRQANPIVSTIAEVGGGLAASIAAPGSALARTPAGFLAQAGNQATAAIRTGSSGVKALVGSAAITGTEVAAQNAGQYLGQIALGDRELTAEGLGGALKSGFLLGGLGGGAIYGIEKGTIAARRLFPHAMEGGEDAARSAASTWERRSTEAFDANRQTLDAAKQRLNEAAIATQQTRLAQQRASQRLAEEKALARRAGPETLVDDVPPTGGPRDVPAPAGLADDAIPPPPATSIDDQARLGAAVKEAEEAEAELMSLLTMERRVAAGEVPGEIGPFNERGLRLAAEREIGREATRVAEREALERTIASDPNSLEAQLAQMKLGLDSGGSIGEMAATKAARPLSPRQLEGQYDEIMERAAQATDPAARQQLLRQASEIEAQIPAAKPSVLSDIDSVTQAMGRYERAMADVTDAVGDGAAPLSREMTDQLRKAETESERAMLDRAAQAVDEAAEGASAAAPAKRSERFGPFEDVGPTRLAPQERIAYARGVKEDAGIAYRKALGDETEARAAYKGAKEQFGQRKADAKLALDAVSLDAPTAPGKRGGAGTAADIGGVLELADAAGIPGLPKPSDLPIIGPVLGLWLKLRAVKAGADRLMGRIPATGNGKVAMLAAKTKDRAARAVDQMLAKVERAAPAARSSIGPRVRLIEALGDRIFDDGEPAPKKDAGLQDLVAARAREVSALAANPALIAKQVRTQMRDVSDPDVIAAAIKFRTNQINYLNEHAPKPPPPSPFERQKWTPAKPEATDWARRYEAAMDPVVALEQVEQQTLTPEAAEAFRAVYPRLFVQTQERLMTRATELQTKLPRAQLTRMSILFDLPLDSALEPETLATIQSVYAPTSPAEPSQQQTPPAPSIAGATNLTSLYQTASDRRAAAR